LDNFDDFIDINDINMDNVDDDGSSQKRLGGQKNLNNMKVRADKVGDVLHNELDIEFDDDIKDNL